MKQRAEDERVTAPLLSWRLLIILFFVLLVLVIAQFYIVKKLMDQIPALVVTLTGYLFGTCLLLTLAVGFFWRYVVSQPLRQLTKAARKAASGDFSVQIERVHRNGRQNEIDVLIDDFNRMTRELAENEMLKSDFIANVSHEIKTPAAVIQSYSKALEDESLSVEERKQYLETVNHASVQLSNTVSSILMLNKLEHREIYPEPKTYLLSEQLRQCALANMDSWEKKNIDFSIDVQDVMVCTQKELLDVVWNNLITNAVKYTRPGGSIAITSAIKDSNVYVSVKDTGIGMSDEVQAHIFDKFYQGDPSRSSEGTGLGLALVKEILRITDGEITVESEPGKGSCFTVKLPFISH